MKYVLHFYISTFRSMCAVSIIITIIIIIIKLLERGVTEFLDTAVYSIRLCDND